MLVRTCLVTGAGRGIGRAVAVALASAGHQLALTARSADELAETAVLAEAAVDPVRPVLIVPADLTRAGAVDDIYSRVEREMGPVDILVANAGSAVSGPLAKITDEDWQRMLDINLTAPFRCIRRALPGMVERGYGRIVVIGSVASKQGAAYISAYAASKHGVLGLVRSAAVEVARTGVTVNAVCPSYVDTPMTDESVANIASRTGRGIEEARAMLEAQQPIHRLITAGEVAAAVMFCVDNPAVTGQGINVDGGTVQS